MTTIWIDYNRYLGAEEIVVPLRQSQLAELAPGVVVMVEGDDGIPERKATVLSIEGRSARLRFLDPIAVST